MEGGIAVDDVTKKIKTAITNKLIELGSYVDEELPDYIMVMVANKKSHAQMTNDLNLFLGSNTRNFTTWLHGILETVQGEPEEKNKEKKRKTPPLQTPQAVANKSKEKDKWFLVDIEKPTSTTKPKAIVTEEETHLKTPDKEGKSKIPLQKDGKPKLPLQKDGKLKTLEKEAKPKTLENKVKPKIQDKEPKSKSPEKDIVTSTDTREETDDVISFRTETDDVLTKELQQEDEKELSPLKTKKTMSDGVKPRSSSKSPETFNKRLPILFPKRDTTLHKAAIKIRPMLQRKGPTSTVNSVIRKPPRIRGLSYDEEEEEYDPCKPAVGSVASIVRVTERRSSVPPELQANKLLLFRAIEDANKSLTKKPSIRGSARVAPYKPTPIEPIPEAKPVPPQEVKAVQTNEKELMVDELLKEAESETSSEMVQVVSPIKKQNLVKRHLEKVVGQPVIQDVFHENLDEVSQTVIVSPNRGVKRKIEDEIPITPMEEAMIETVLPEPPSHTRFVVTLDGVNPSSLFKKPKVELEVNLASTKRIFTPVTPPEIVDEAMYDNDLELIEKYDPDELTMSMEDEEEDEHMICVDYDDNSFEESEILEKKNVRCQYWPACSRGDSCIYIHPSKPCKNFPVCNFGSKCINIHPNCKFDSQCTRPDCPFTHASKRNTVVSAPPPIHVKKPKFIVPIAKPTVTTMCKFFPVCKNSSCPFIHPKLCRYGSFCKTANCPFTHPKTPSVEKLKWVAAVTKTEKS